MNRTLRRLPLPVNVPPFDDEVPVHARSHAVSAASSASRLTPPQGRLTQGSLALSFMLPSGLPAVPVIAPLRLVPDDVPARDPHPDSPDRRPGAATGRPVDPHRWAATLTQAVLESVYGPRPVHQLARWLDEPVYRALAAHAASRHGKIPQVRSVRACQPTPGVAEASVVIQTGPRVRAAALRLEARASRWLCTAFDLV